MLNLRGKHKLTAWQWVLVVLFVVVALALLMCIPALLIMWGWNFILAPLTGWGVMGFWPAYGLAWIVSLLFNGGRGSSK